MKIRHMKHRRPTRDRMYCSERWLPLRPRKGKFSLLHVLGIPRVMIGAHPYP